MNVRTAVLLLALGAAALADPLAWGVAGQRDVGLALLGLGLVVLVVAVQKTVLKLALAVLVAGVGGWLVLPHLGYDPIAVLEALRDEVFGLMGTATDVVDKTSGR